MAVPRIHIVGRQNSGKTTLIVELVEHLSGLGYGVGTIKHTHHRHELDTPGKDSYRHRNAGAVAVGILSRGMSAVFRPIRDTDAPADRYAWLQRMFSDCDLLLVEGDSQTDGVKVEVWRAAASQEPLATEDASILAVVTDDPIAAAVPVWSRSNVPALARRLLRLTCGLRTEGDLTNVLESLTL